MPTKTTESASVLKLTITKVLDLSVSKIVDGQKKTGAEVVGPIPLPTERQIYTILRSPFVHKDSREQFKSNTQAVDLHQQAR